MKNVTTTVDEDVARWAKVWAAENDTSLSRILGDERRRKMKLEQNYSRARRRFFVQISPRTEAARNLIPQQERAV